MEIKSISDCLNFIVSIILCNIQDQIAVENLENIRNFMIGMYNDKYVEDMVVMPGLLSQINLIVERFYIDNDNNLKNEYWVLRQHKLARLMENKKKPEDGVNEQE